MFKTTFRSLTAAVCAVAALAIATPAFAEATVGEPAPQFELTHVKTGNSHALSDFSDKVVVVVFQSIHCPWDKMRENGGYQRMLSPMAEKYADKGVQFLAINSNKNESAEQVASYLDKHSIPYPILKDPGNQIADAYGAQTTPHVYVISKGEQELLYKGGIEEVPGSPAQCGQMDEQYLKPVLDAVLAGKDAPYTVTKSKGCSIKRVKK